MIFRFVRQHRLIKTALLLSSLVCAGSIGHAQDWQHSLAMHGEAKFSDQFSHFDYVNPEAPRGGSLRLARIGSFDSVQPYILLGRRAKGHDLVYESLMARSADEAFSLYPLIAEAVRLGPDRRWIEFRLNPAAAFSNGNQVTTKDVYFSWEILRTQGRPNTRLYYSLVEQAEILSPQVIRFTFKPSANAEMPLILGLMPVLSSQYYAENEFNRTTLIPAPGTGPYALKRVEAGRLVEYHRRSDYWGKDLAVQRGRHNFDVVKYDYYRDQDIAFEAFKSGEFDWWRETDPARWANGYQHQRVTSGDIIQQAVPHRRPQGMLGLVFNSRRPMLSDVRVRRALSRLYDFAWINRNLFHGSYQRTRSYFANSSFDESAPDSQNQSVIPDGSYRGLRLAMRQSLRDLSEAGWVVRDGKLISSRSDQPMTLEILVGRAAWERFLLPYADNLQKIGIDVQMRRVDSAIYASRLRNFDFDLIVNRWGQSESPGNEQSFYWSTTSAETPGSRNYPGIRDQLVDQLVNDISSATSRVALTRAVRALDQRLLSRHWVLPLQHETSDRMAYQAGLKFPEHLPNAGAPLDLWWWEEGGRHL